MNSTRYIALSSAALVVLSFVVDFLHVDELGLLSDDWGIIGQVLWDDQFSIKGKVAEYLTRSWEGRPLHAIEIVIRWAGCELFGLRGAFLNNWLFIAASVVLFYQLMRERYSDGIAFGAAALFTVFPSDTTHVWANCLVLRMSMVYVLAACLLFCRGSNWLATVLCAMAVFSYELSLFVFVLAPWFADRGKRESVFKAGLILAGVLAVYLACRLLLFPLLGVIPPGDDSRLSSSLTAVGEQGWLTALLTWLSFFPKSVLYSYAVWPLSAVYAVFAKMNWHSVWALCGGAALAFIGFRTLLGDPVCRIRFIRRSGEENIDSESIVRGNAFLIDIGWGLLGIMATACLSFWAYPNIYPTVVSRFNYYAVPGAVIALVATVQLAAGLTRNSTLRSSVFLLCVLVLAGSIQYRYQIQRDWIAVASQQRAIMRGMLAQIEVMPQKTHIVIANPPRRAPGRPIGPFTRGATWETNDMMRLLYDSSVSARVVHSPREIELEIESVPVENVLLYNVPSTTLRWARRGDISNLVSPNADVLAYLRRDL